MANPLPHEPSVDPSPVSQGDLPGAYNRSHDSRPISSPQSHVRTVALGIGLAILAVIVLALAVGDDDRTTPVNPEGAVPVEARP